MLSQKQIDLMKEITQVMAISGDEQELSQILYKHYKPLADEIVYDQLGSIYAIKRCGKENAPLVMISGHMDEIGFIVQQITEKGALKIAPIGGWWSQVLLSSRVLVKARDGQKYKGTIASIPPHLLSPEVRNKPMEISNMLVDIGCDTKEEVEALKIKAGSPLILEGPFEILDKGKRLLAKAWDNRYGCIAGIEVLEALKDIDLDVDVAVGANVQEEVGTRGAQTASYLIKPDLAIVLDCSPANDLSGDKNAFGQLGKGPLVRFIDANYLPHRGFINFYEELLEKNKIPFQYYQSMGGTDAGAIHKQYDGIPTLTQCICARNIHSPSSIIDVDDYENALKAVLAVLKSLNNGTIDTIKKANQ